PKAIEGTGPDIFIVKSGSLGLPLDGWDFPAFLKKYPLQDMRVGKAVVNTRHEYGGTPDIEYCVYDGVPTLADVKRTPDKVKNFTEVADYAKTSVSEPVQQLMIVPINDKTDQGFSKPIVTAEVDKYFEL